MSSKFSFKNRCIIVTGSGGGLGEVYVRLLASLGASVVVTDLGPSCEAVAASIVSDGGDAIAIKGSVTSEEDVKRIVDAAVAKYGRVDGLVNNAGIGREQPFVENSMETIRLTMDVHFYGTVLMTRAVWPHMAKAGYGRIVNITSSNVFGLSGWAVYGAAKAAVLSLGRALALEGAPSGIHVNITAPAALTSMLLDNIKDQAILDSVKNAKPELCGPLVAYLLHDSNPYNGRTFFNGSGHIASIFLGQTQGATDLDLTIDKVAEMLADEATHSNFKVQTSTVEQSQEQAS